MRLPQPQLESVCFLFEKPAEVIRAMGDECLPEEAKEIERLCGLGLPPVTSHESLSVMFGYNPGFVWSLVNRTHRHYRHFKIPKGAGEREIEAPKVGLKSIQKWLSYHFQKTWQPINNVFGFVPARSHIDAAKVHVNAEWVYSVDIENFFPSVPQRRVNKALRSLGYQTPESIEILTSLCCLYARLVQGAPTSPVISNVVLHDVDQQLNHLATDNGMRFTRYADDIVFSGTGEISTAVQTQIKSILTNDGWTLSERKEELAKLPDRLKVHGLLVHGDTVRLTKGYRNRIRAYRHLFAQGKIKEEDLGKIMGHLNYASQIDS